MLPDSRFVQLSWPGGHRALHSAGLCWEQRTDTSQRIARPLSHRVKPSCKLEEQTHISQRTMGSALSLQQAQCEEEHEEQDSGDEVGTWQALAHAS